MSSAMEAFTERHFFHHGDDQDVSPEERKSCHWCQLRSFETHKDFPITIVNETADGAVLPSNFTFIDRSILRPGVQPTDRDFRSGCDCPDAEDCMYDTCKCLDEVDGGDSDQDLDLDDEEREIVEWAEAQRKQQERARHRGSRDGSGETSTPGPSRPQSGPAALTANGGLGRLKKRFSYHTQGAKAGLLRGANLGSLAPIYECHEGCHCDKALCPNRVVERGRQIPLQIFRTDDGRGWGVKTMREIKRGQFVDRYIGEIITPAEASRRRERADKAQLKDIYLFALDKFTGDPESHDPRLRGAPLEVDGEFMSGPTRFINHSCDPNTAIFARVGDRADKHLHDLALFALRDIPKGDELNFDYNGRATIESHAKDEAMQGEMTKCLCGTDKCRGYIW